MAFVSGLVLGFSWLLAKRDNHGFWTTIETWWTAITITRHTAYRAYYTIIHILYIYLHLSQSNMSFSHNIKYSHRPTTNDARTWLVIPGKRRCIAIMNRFIPWISQWKVQEVMIESPRLRTQWNRGKKNCSLKFYQSNDSSQLSIRIKTEHIHTNKIFMGSVPSKKKICQRYQGWFSAKAVDDLKLNSCEDVTEFHGIKPNKIPIGRKANN